MVFLINAIKNAQKSNSVVIMQDSVSYHYPGHYDVRGSEFTGSGQKNWDNSLFDCLKLICF